MPRAQQNVFFKANPFKITLLCISLSLFACKKQDQQPAVEQKAHPVELIQQDIVEIKQGDVSQKTAFTGTIRAINQSSIQTQVTATASQVYVQVGQSVEKGQILVRLNNQDNASRLAQSRANKASAEAQANQARNMVNRKKRLYDQGFISKVEYEQSQVDYQGQLENVKAQQANVDIALKADQDGVIRSPISGVITKRQVDVGQTVAAGQSIFEIVDPHHLEIQAKLPIDQQAALQIGHQIEFNIQGSAETYKATLSRISPIADQVSRQIEFFATPNQAINSLSIGAFIDGNIIGSSRINGQMIPLDSVRDLKNKPYVWVVRNNKVQQIFVQILQQRLNDNVAVVQGLNQGDLIIKTDLSHDDINKPVSIAKN
ncbi:efflux RND transporter periplasmic adaptor subunit [Acinetobacter gerneri]|jgi:RND family efflux transporter MFP subunit|uniref:efflux RND transporter periplasmic adaptor subunit n=1 Tax=Acinetobacter gerneri TaxID=202952 RepID=UPI0023F4E05B|nr:efflux RND transporter periplasmic adaptor subunit [Acinetobacter gerneri]MCH4244443.1 efflux RND transporter periplasmic adaptor subunit [Acinetobacter gerneri]